MFLDKFSNENKISKLIEIESRFLLSAVSDRMFLYLITFDKFISWNKIIEFLPHIIKENKKILVESLKDINNYIKLIWVIQKFDCMDNIIDVNGLYYSKYNKPLKSGILKKYNYNDNYITVWKKYKSFINTRFAKKNIEVPLPIISDWIYEKSISLLNIYNDLKGYQNSGEYKAYILRSIIFYQLEKNGLRIDNKFFKLFPDIKDGNINQLKNKKIIHPTAKIDSSVTGRVSYSYKKINFMALDKKSKINNIIISRFGNDGKLYNFDYDAFHPRIIFQLMNKTIPLNKKGHEYLAKKYFNIGQLSHSEIKQKIFKILYGKYIKNNKFSELMQLFQNKVDVYKTPLGRSIVGISEQKKVNYFMQKYEVDLMTIIMKRIFNLLEDYKSVLCLYQYDSLIADIHNDEEPIVDKIIDIMENVNNMTFKVKVNKGNNLQEIR